MDETQSTIRVAILGGGLAGISMLRGLLKYPHIAVDVYESRPSSREEGSALEFSGYTEEALYALDPSLEQSLGRAGGILTTAEVRMASGPFAGQVISANCTGSGAGEPHKTVVGCQDMLSELSVGLPHRALHYNTRVTAIHEGNINGSYNGNGAGGAVLYFADGSQKQYDVVISADRMQGISRQYVLDSSGQMSEPQPTGFWGLHVTVPVERARRALGPEFLGSGPTTQVRWVGDGTFMQHVLLNGGRDVQLVVYVRLDSQYADGDESPWIKLFTPREFKQLFTNCQPATCRGIVKVCIDRRNQKSRQYCPCTPI